MRRICVYCGSNPGNRPEYAAAAKQLADVLVRHELELVYGGADKGIAMAQAKLKKATTEAERNAAQEELVKWQKNREDGVKALKERQEVVDKALQEEPKLLQQLEAAKKALTQAQANTLKAVDALNLESFLSSDRKDSRWRNTSFCSRPRRVVWRSLPSREKCRSSWSSDCWPTLI